MEELNKTLRFEPEAFKLEGEFSSTVIVGNFFQIFFMSH